MSLILRVPWTYDKRTCNKLLEEVAYKMILRNICINHRFFDSIWINQPNKCPSKWYGLMVELANKGIYSSNRREHLPMALHCLYNGIQIAVSGNKARDEFLETAKCVLIQLESKISNRYLHDIKIYAYKKPVKYHEIINERVYLVQYQYYDLAQNYTTNDPNPELEIDYNFPMQSKLTM